MSAIARALIGEDEERAELMRLARAGLPQDRLRMIKVKRALESLGYRHVTIYQSQTADPRYVIWAVIINGDFSEWPIGLADQRRKRREALIRHAMDLAGFRFIDQGYVDSFETNVWPDQAELRFHLNRLGPFHGRLGTDYTWTSP